MKQLSGPIFVEVEPGHSVDLACVFEWDDDPAKEQLLIFLPAPAVSSRKYKVRPGDGPHALLLTGESRRLALVYFRLQVRRAADLLTSLQESDAKGDELSVALMLRRAV